MSDMIDDNRFVLIKKYKQKLIEGTNISDSPEDMAAINSILFRFWQMGWLDKLEEEPHWIPVTEQEPKESGKYLVTAVIGFVPDHVDDPNTYEAVTTANYSADTRGPIKWWGNNVEKVLAWMPLPEPYKGVTE